MKRNDITALASKSTSELQAQLTQLMAEVTKARLAKKTGRLANLRSISHLNDDIARIKTIMRQKQLTGQEA